TALTARRLGLRAGIVTSFGPDYPADAIPDDIEVVNIPSERTTVFAFQAGAWRRRLTLVSRATDIEAEHLPADWARAPLVMLCPVINEGAPAFAGGFTDASVGVLPQGWMRGRGAGGAVTAEPWEDAPLVLPHAQLVVVSAEDIEPVQKQALEWFQ